MKNYAYNDFGNLIAMKTSNSGPQLMGDEVLSHAVNSKTDAITETLNSGPQSIENEVLSHALNSGTNAIAEISNSGHLASSHALNSETNAITETSNSGSQSMGNEILSHALNSETNAIAETLNSSNNASAGDLIGWCDTPITEIDIRSFNPFRFSSEYHDDELSLIYYNYRHYNPTTGRFLSRDPIEEQGGTNLYNFTTNNPINYFDIYGLFLSIHQEPLPIFDGINTTYIPAMYEQYEKEFTKWYEREKRRLLEKNQNGKNWVEQLPKCPARIFFKTSTFFSSTLLVGSRTVINPDPSEWEFGKFFFVTGPIYHPGGEYELRTKNPERYNGSGNQCVYDECGALMNEIPAAGTTDLYSPNGDVSEHRTHDIKPFNLARKLDDFYNTSLHVNKYYEVRPQW